MSFDSLTFLVFFLIVVLLHRAPLPWRVKKWNLLVASYLFYMAWNPPFVILLWISTATDWFVGNRLARTDAPGPRRRWLWVSLGVNLGLLGFFKYAGFLLENFVWLVSLLGIDYRPPPPDIILPLGISFYTFQTLSYTITIYRRHGKPADSLLDFALFVTFFPQLVAGPIVRAHDFITQLTTPCQATARQFGWGLVLLVLGLFEKVVLADAMLAPIADAVYGAAMTAGTLDAWIGSLAFGGQILFDFAGYSSCAIGAALCLGFILPENFRFPYAAVGFADFWRRWHITLSTWLRDYLYFTMASNRPSQLRIYISLATTMLLGGLWHGASWSFVLWGGLHGFYLVAERFLRARFGGVSFFQTRSGQVLLGLMTFGLVTLTWVFFRAQGIDESWALFTAMTGDVPSSVCRSADVLRVAIVLGGTLIASALLRNSDLEDLFSRLPSWLQAPLVTLLILALIAAPGDDRAFIYFQF